MPDPSQEKSELRREIRALRASLCREEQRSAGSRMAQRVSSTQQWTGARRVAIYLPQNGEMDTLPLVEFARDAGKQLYLPVLAGDGHMDFALWRREASLPENRYGIPEPDSAAPRLPAGSLDLILVPLVAWSGNGTRLGMGGGYYDRSLAQVRSLKMGLAYEWQRRDDLPSEAWDVRLDMVATEAAVHDCRGNG